jgi:ubiquinone/menaquinone biosynthesis C-methylase UbiE
MAKTQTTQAIREQVRSGYAQIAVADNKRRGKGQASSCCGPSSCCGQPQALSAKEIARTVGYAKRDLAALPEGANMGLSCGNPVAIAQLKPGEVVLDLGSGGGFDVFQAARRVGPKGWVIGVDMTPEMLAKARRNAETFTRKSRLKNVEFRLGEIEHLPVADASVDVVLSNCVINLSPDKPQVWREIARVLKPGGRVSVSDLALHRPLPKAVRGMLAALVGCVAGAVLLKEYIAMVRAAGLTSIRVTPKPDYVKALSRFRDPLYRKIARHLPKGTEPADFVVSVNVEAVKRSR